MEVRENEIRVGNVKFNGYDISITAKMVDALSSTIDVIYYLMDHGEERAFVLMLLSAQNVDMKVLLEKEKRDTDILFEIDKESSLYAVICQDTKIDGGYHFAERVVRDMSVDNAEEIYCVELEVRTTEHNIKYVIFKLIETWIKAREDKKEGEIIFNTLH